MTHAEVFDNLSPVEQQLVSGDSYPCIRATMKFKSGHVTVERLIFADGSIYCINSHPVMGTCSYPLKSADEVAGADRQMMFDMMFRHILAGTTMCGGNDV